MSTPQRTQISYTPHHKTLTASGHYHFSRVSDAIAEFVDNSIQATCSAKNQSRDINVSVYLQMEDYNGFILISDNGMGMETQELEQFATYSLDQVSRGNNPVEGGNHSFISKYGVGAKQAGFYFGDRIHIITTKSKGPQNLFEMIMDEKEYENRFLKNENVYTGEVIQRSPNQILQNYSDIKFSSLQLALSRHEEVHSHFTCIIVRLRNNFVRRLLTDEKYRNIPTELADIYYFHMHPEHTPNKILGEKRFQSTPRSRGGNHTDDLKIQNPIRGSFDNDESPVNLSMYISVNENTIHDNISLNSFESPMQNYIKSAQWAFRFNMTVPDPNPMLLDSEISNSGISGLTQETRRLQKSTTNSINSLTGAVKHPRTIQCIIFYYPSIDGQETFPTSTSLQSDSNNSNGDNDDAASSIFCLNEDDDTNTDHPIFDIFWQCRLVPESKVKSLPFFPEAATTRLQCDLLGVPENWRRRLKGFMFFDADFTHISNNKLKIQVDPDLHTWLNHKLTYQDTICKPTCAENEFKLWLAGCHKKFDQDFRFESRITVPNEISNGKAVFTKVKVGQDTLVLQGGDIVRLFVTSSGRGGKGRERYGKIKHFEVDYQYLTGDQSYCYGRGNIVYHRVPEEVFGKATSPLSISMTALKFDGKTKVGKAEIAELIKSAVKKVTILLCSESEPNGKLLIENKLECEAGKIYTKIAIQLVNGSQKIVTGQPQEIHHKYKLKLRMSTATGTTTSSGDAQADVVMDGSWRELADEDENRTTVTNTSSATAKSKKGAGDKLYFVFPDVKFLRVGDYSLSVEVLDTPVKRVIDLKVNSCRPTSFRVDFSARGGLWALGSFLPQFTLQFLDSLGNNAAYVGRLQIFMSDSESKLLVTCDETKDPCFEMEASEEGQIFFGNDQWMAVPNSTSEEPLLSHDRIESIDISFRITCDICPDFSVDFNMLYGPGEPYLMRLLEPDSEELTVVNGEVIPMVKLALFDRWRNRSCPDSRGEQWFIAVDPTGPLAGSGAGQCPVLGSGEAVFVSSLRADISEILPQQGLVKKQLFRLVRSGGEGDGGEIHSLIRPLELSVRVIPGKAPSTIEILRDGLLVPRPWREAVGTLVSGLTFRVISEDGEEFELSEGDLLRGRTGGIRVSWRKESLNKAARRNPNPNSSISSSSSPLNALPDIQLSTGTAEAAGEDYEVTLNFARFEPLSTDFSIHLVPGVAESWSMLHSDDIADGILNKDSSDLMRKLRGICMLDKYGNITSSHPATNSRSLLPILEGKWNDSNDIEEEDDEETLRVGHDSDAMELGNDNHHPMTSPAKLSQHSITNNSGNCRPGNNTNNTFLNQPTTVFSIPLVLSQIQWGDNVETIATRKSFNGKNNTKSVTLPTPKTISVYVIAPNFYVTAPTVPSLLRLRIRDAENTLLPWSHLCAVTAGRPNQVMMTSESLGILDLGKYSQVTVLPWSEVTDLMLGLVDCAGQPATLTGAKNLLLEIVGPNDLLVWRKKNCKSDTVAAAFKFSKIFDALAKGSSPSGPLEVALQCRGSYVSETGETVDISFATLALRTKPMNLVTQLSLELVMGGEGETIPATGGMPAARCDEMFPSFKIGTVTDDGNPFSPPADFLTVSVFMVPDKGSKNIHTVDPQSLFASPKPMDSAVQRQTPVKGRSPDRSQGGSSPRCSYSYMYQSIAPLPIATGTYTFVVGYEERRQELMTIPAALRKVTAECKFRVVPGRMVRLALADSVGASIKSLVSNSSCSTEERMLSSNRLKIVGYDTGDNICNFRTDVFIGCYLRRSMSTGNTSSAASTSTSSDMPQIVGADGYSGVLFAERCKDHTGFQFPPLQLQPGVGRGNDEAIELIFCAYQTQSSQSTVELTNVKAFIKSFRFTSDQDKSEKAALLSAAIQPLLDAVAAHKSEVACTLTTISSLLASMSSIMRRSPTGSLRPYVSDPGRLTLQEADRLVNELQGQKSDMENCISQIRPVTKRPHCPPESAIAGKAVTGQVCSLGFVDDYATALVMSWAAMSRIDAVVVPTSAVATQLYRENVKVWAEDQMSRFEIRHGHEEPRCRNAQEMQRGVLPLPPITWDQPGPVPGHPRYMVNIMQLDERSEYLRDTVFHLIFQRMILFDTLEAALKYRGAVVSQRKQVPNLYTMDGHKVSADGVLDPKVGAGRLPERLDFIFGAQLPNTTEEFRIVELDLQILVEIRPLLQQFEIVKSQQRDLMQHQPRIQAHEEEIEELNRQLDLLGKENMHGNGMSQNDNGNNGNNRVVGEKNKIRPPSGPKDLKRQRIQIGYK